MTNVDDMSYLRYCTNDLHSHFLSCPDIKRFHNFAKRALAKQLYQIVSFSQFAILLNNVVSIFVVDFLVGFMPLHKELLAIQTFASHRC